MDIFGFLRTFFKFPNGHERQNRSHICKRSYSRSKVNKDGFFNFFGNRPADEFGNPFHRPVWNEENDEGSRESFQSPDHRGGFGFQLFTNTSDMQRFVENQMSELLRSFSEMTDFPLFGSFHLDQENPALDSAPPEFDSSGYHSSRPKSLRDEFLKPEPQHRSLFYERCSKSDNDLDGQMHSDQLYSFLRRNYPENNTNMELVPFQEQPSTSGGSFSFTFGKSISSQTVRNSDGSMETRKTVRDSQGNEETIVTIKNNSEMYTKIIKKDPRGNVTETEEILPIT